MIACVNVMIDNVDAYDDWRGDADIYRYQPTRGLRFSSFDIDGIEQAAIETRINIDTPSIRQYHQHHIGRAFTVTQTRANIDYPASA